MSASTRTAPVHDVAWVSRLFALGYSLGEVRSFGNPPEPVPGFVTFFDPGLSIVELRARVDSKLFYPQHWYDDQPFARFEEHPRYRQLRMEAVKDSFGKTFVEQQALVASDTEIPMARVVLIGMVVHFLATGERLFFNHCVRCADGMTDIRRANVGNFGSGGFILDCRWDGRRYDFLGLASSRKF